MESNRSFPYFPMFIQNIGQAFAAGRDFLDPAMPQYSWIEVAERGDSKPR